MCTCSLNLRQTVSAAAAWHTLYRISGGKMSGCLPGGAFLNLQYIRLIRNPSNAGRFAHVPETRPCNPSRITSFKQGALTRACIFNRKRQASRASQPSAHSATAAQPHSRPWTTSPPSVPTAGAPSTFFVACCTMYVCSVKLEVVLVRLVGHCFGSQLPCIVHCVLVMTARAQPAHCRDSPPLQSFCCSASQLQC